MTKHDLKELAAMGAELGAAKAEVERLSHKLERARDHLTHARHDVEIRANAGNDAARLVLKGIDQWLSDYDQSPDDTYTAVEMATAAAQGFRDGQAAVEQAPVQDEREAVERFSPTTSVPHCGRASEVEAYMTEDDDGEYMTVSQHERIVAALTRPAQTEQQPEQSGKFAMHQRVRKTSGSEWHGRICGTYSTSLTPEGYAVESEAHAGSVQIYPAKALEAVE